MSGGVLERATSLREESERVLRKVATPLHRCLSLCPPAVPHVHDAALVLWVQLSIVKTKNSVLGLQSTFEAVAMLVNHSNALRALPKLKVDLWTRVMQSPMMSRAWVVKDPIGTGDLVAETRLTHGIEDWMLKHEDFPLVRINCVPHSPAEEVSEQSLDAIYQAMTTPLSLNLSCLVDPELRWFNFHFPPLSVRRLQLVRDFLKKLHAHPSCRFRVARITFELLRTKNAHERVLIDIFQNNNGVYKIPEIHLDRNEDLLAGYYSHGAFLSSIFALPSTGSGVLRSVRLDECWLHADHVAIICSALRYQSGIEELSLQRCFWSHSESHSKQCWGWLAFALFFPPSKRIAGAAWNYKRRTINLAENHIGVDKVETFRRTLRNPAELVLQGTEELQAVSSVQVTTFLKGSSFHTERNATSAVLLVLTDEEADFETLCERDGWICAVLPARGLGWVQAHQCARANQEDKEEERGAINHLSPVSRCRGDVHLRIYKGTRSIELGGVFRSFIELVGPQLCGLEMTYCYFSDRNCDDLRAIGSSCVNLESLVLRSCGFKPSTAHQLVRELCGGLGRNLISLDLTASHFPDTAAIDYLSQVLLRTPACLPNLQALHLGIKEISPRAMKNIYECLHLRTKLVALELEWPEVRLCDCAGVLTNVPSAKRVAFVAEYQKYLSAAKSRLTLAHKLAFISLVTSADHTGNRSALCRLDVEAIAMIFKFAGRQIHRQIKRR